MAHSYLPETPRGTAAIKKLQIATLIADLTRTAAILTAELEHEETRAGVRDVSGCLCGAGAEPVGAKGEHQGDHRFAGGVGARGTQGGLRTRRPNRDRRCRIDRPRDIGAEPAHHGQGAAEVRQAHHEADRDRHQNAARVANERRTFVRMSGSTLVRMEKRECGKLLTRLERVKGIEFSLEVVESRNALNPYSDIFAALRMTETITEFVVVGMAAP
jgi:hypothetical protein